MAGMAGTVVVGTGMTFCSTFEAALGRRYLDMLLTGPSPCCCRDVAPSAASSFAADSSAAARLTDR